MRLCADEVVDDLPWFKVHACFLAFLHLQTELQLAHPNHKNDHYRSATQKISCTISGSNNQPYRDAKEMQEMLHYCQLAKWAYAKHYLELHAHLKAVGYELIRHDMATEPGRVGHFVAVKHDQKLAVIAIKGTSTMSDVLTDVLGQAMDHSLENANRLLEGQNITTAHIHEGMYAAAQLLLDDTLHLVEHFFLPREYRVVVTGHSLGAGVG